MTDAELGRLKNPAGDLMPEIPDFDQIAKQIFAVIANTVATPLNRDALPEANALAAAIAEQLRLIWNARGAADAELISSEPDLVLAIQKLDR